MLTPGDLARWRRRFTEDPDAALPVATDEDQTALVDRVMTTVDRLEAAAAPRHGVGDRVVVRRWHDPVHHHRCPRYVRGVTGVVETVCGDEPVPGAEHERAPTYTVAFASHDLWGDDAEAATVHVDLCERYLEPSP